MVQDSAMRKTVLHALYCNLNINSDTIDYKKRKLVGDDGTSGVEIPPPIL